MVEANAILSDNPAELRAYIDSLRTALEQKDNRIHEIENQLFLEKEKYDVLFRRFFSKKSEKHADSFEQLLLFNEAEAGANEKPEEVRVITVTRSVGKKKGRKPIPQNIPRREVIHELTEEERTCSCCGERRPEIGEERTEELNIIPARAEAIVHVRKKVGPCRCEEFKNSGASSILTAPGPAKIVPGSAFSNASIAFFLTAKYADALPFYRMEKVLARMGIEVGRATLCNLAIRAGSQLGALLDRLREDVRGSPVVKMDETVVQVLKEPGRSPTSQSRMWVSIGYIENKPIIFYTYDPSRAGKVAQSILGGFRGRLQTDGYSGYTAIGNSEGIIHVGCWAHIRRPFMDALKLADGNSPIAKEALDIIQGLYAAEKELRTRLNEGQISGQRFLDERRVRVEPIFRRFLEFCHTNRGKAAPKTILGKALEYALGQFERAVRYLEHILLTPDNNDAENAIRPFVIGRKNWLFSDTQRGAHASAGIYSLVETAKANGHEPYKYMCILFEKLPHVSDAVGLEKLLPYRLAPSSY